MNKGGMEAEGLPRALPPMAPLVPGVGEGHRVPQAGSWEGWLSSGVIPVHVWSSPDLSPRNASLPPTPTGNCWCSVPLLRLGASGRPEDPHPSLRQPSTRLGEHPSVTGPATPQAPCRSGAGSVTRGGLHSSRNCGLSQRG